MADFDLLIRPFQSPSNSPPKREFEARKYTPPLRLQFGKSGSGKSIGGSYSLSAKWFKETSVREVTQR